jgi:UDP-N-acetyl-D-galactosamine dehydrogenase
MPSYVANQVVKMLIKAGNKVEWSKVLVMGLTFKENVPDFRNSKIADTIKELKEFWVQVTGVDPYHNYLNDHDLLELNVTQKELATKPAWTYDGIIFAQSHKEFEDIDLKEHLTENGILFDIKGKFRKSWFTHYKSL